MLLPCRPSGTRPCPGPASPPSRGLLKGWAASPGTVTPGWQPPARWPALPPARTWRWGWVRFLVPGLRRDRAVPGLQGTGAPQPQTAGMASPASRPNSDPAPGCWPCCTWAPGSQPELDGQHSGLVPATVAHLAPLEQQGCEVGAGWEKKSHYPVEGSPSPKPVISCRQPVAWAQAPRALHHPLGLDTLQMPRRASQGRGTPHCGSHVPSASLVQAQAAPTGAKDRRGLASPQVQPRSRAVLMA